jgi:hypothetical protein
MRLDTRRKRDLRKISECSSLMIKRGSISINQPRRETQTPAENSTSILSSRSRAFTRDKWTRVQQGKGGAWNRLYHTVEKKRATRPLAALRGRQGRGHRSKSQGPLRLRS